MYGFYNLHIDIKNYNLSINDSVVEKLNLNIKTINKLNFNFDIIDTFMFKFNYIIMQTNIFFYNINSKFTLNIALLYEVDEADVLFVTSIDENYIVLDDKMFYVKKLEYAKKIY